MIVYCLVNTNNYIHDCKTEDNDLVLYLILFSNDGRPKMFIQLAGFVMQYQLHDQLSMFYQFLM
jgi:hypothetical protein